MYNYRLNVLGGLMLHLGLWLIFTLWLLSTLLSSGFDEIGSLFS